MRILTISNDPHNPNQGSGYVITGYIDGLRARGHEVDAYGPENFLTFNTHRAKRYLHPLLMARFGLQKVAEKDYDLVECYGASSWILIWLLSKRKRDFALVHHSNGIEPHVAATRRSAEKEGLLDERAWFQLDLTPLHEIGLHAVDAIVTVSAFDAAYACAKRYVPTGQIYAIDNPLPKAFLDQQVDFNRPKRAGYCGMWIARKGTHVLLRDVARFLRQFPDWTFSFVGVNDALDCQRFPDDVRDRVEIIPFLDRDKLIGWYHSLSLLVLPSVYESFGLVMAEAMACGVALVATEVGYAASLEHWEEVFHLSIPKPPHLLDALSELAENDTLRRRIARNGYEAVQDLRWEPAVDRLEDIYEGLVRKRPTA